MSINLPVKLRPANMDDAEDVLDWRNDAETRAMSRDDAPIVREAHLTWFEAAIGDPARWLLIAEIEGQKVGMVRFDQVRDAWEVSLNVAPSARSRGLGRAMLACAIARIDDELGSTSILAEILSSNSRSVRTFEAVGFRRLNDAGAAVLRYARPASAKG